VNKKTLLLISIILIICGLVTLNTVVKNINDSHKLLNNITTEINDEAHSLLINQSKGRNMYYEPKEQINKVIGATNDTVINRFSFLGLSLFAVLIMISGVIIAVITIFKKS
jgi:hypothetical protein